MEWRWFEDKLLEDANELNLVIKYVVHKPIPSKRDIIWDPLLM